MRLFMVSHRPCYVAEPMPCCAHTEDVGHLAGLIVYAAASRAGRACWANMSQTQNTDRVVCGSPDPA